MSIPKKTSHIRSILKGISWRVIATIETVSVVLCITCLADQCSIKDALAIGFSELFIKLTIYYFHERAWLKILNGQAKTNKEIALKSISWRLIATLTTFIISGIVLDAFTQIAVYIAVTELFTKFVLYYLHEKLWLMLPIGKIRNFFFKKKE